MRRIITILMILTAPFILLAQINIKQDLQISLDKSKQDIHQFVSPIPLDAPFDCSSEFFVTLSNELNTLDPYDFSGGLTLLYDIGQSVNAIGYNVLDDYIYAINSTNTHLIRLHSDATVEDLGDIGLGMNPYTGAFDLDGNYYVSAGGTTVANIDVVGLTFTTVTTSQSFDAADWAYHVDEAKFYGANGNTLYAFDPGTNDVTTSAISGFLGGEGPTFGAAFYFTDGYIYVWNNTTGNLYQIDVSTSEASFIFNGPPSFGFVDGTSCPNAPPPDPIVVAENDTLCLEPTGQQSWFVIDNDQAVFADLDYTSFSVILDPEFGTVTYDDLTGEIIYTANDTPMEDILIYEICCDGSIVVCDQATIYIIAPQTISFDLLDTYCQFDDPDILTTSSDEGVSGYWEPDVIDTDIPGTTEYTFFPNTDSDVFPCSYPLLISVDVIELETPTFQEFGPYCQFDDPDIFPDISIDGINGYWIPDAINTNIFGDFTFTFVPDDPDHPCALESNIDISIIEEVLPTFDPFEPYCLNSSAGELPFMSNEGLFGTWIPATINTSTAGDLTYIFTPDEILHPCALQQSVIITVSELVTPVFASLGPYCVDDVPALLPEISAEGISGNWSPNFIDTSLPGEFQHTFVPDASLYPCALEITQVIIVLEPDSPTFDELGPFCLNATAPLLPVLSNEGIIGSWTPSVISTDLPGTFEYFFIPNDISGCIQESSMSISVLTPISIDLIDKTCSEDLNSYDLEIEISGGSGSYVSLEASGYNILENNNDQYTIVGIGSGDGVEIEVIDAAGCTTIINVLPYDCNCPNIPDPSGMEDLVYCYGTGMNIISIDDPGSGFQVSWYDELGILLSHDNPFITPKPGLYMVTLIDMINGCESSPQFINVSEIPAININLMEIECATDLLSYSLDIIISGGSGNISQILADGYSVINNGFGSYTIEGIPNATGINIQVEDDQDCFNEVSSPPHDCDCAFIASPQGEQLIYYCYGDSTPALTVNDPGDGYQVQWYDANQNMISTGAVFNVADVGIYYAEFLDITNNCKSDQVQIELIQNSEIDFEVLTQICENDEEPFDLLISVTGGTPDYVLSAGGYSVSSITSNQFIVEELTDFIGLNVSIQDNLDCKASFWAAPELLSTPEGDAGSDQLISCTDATATIDATINGNNINAIWSGPDPDFDTQSGQTVVSVAGMYYLTLTDEINSCQSFDSVLVTDALIPDFELEINPILCHDELNASIHFQNVSNGAAPYFYSIDGGNSYSNNSSFNNLGPGSFNLILKDNLECIQDSFVILTNPDSIELIIDSPIELKFGETHQIEVNTNLNEIAIESIFWTPSEGLSCTDCLEPFADPIVSTTYFLEITDISGCEATAFIVISRDVENNIFIPNIFTPNGDGVNDKFYIVAGERVKVIESLDIFSRWGEIVFSAGNFPPNDAEYGWDGFSKNVSVDPGVFVYMAKIQLLDGSILIYSGDLTLLK